MFKRISLEILKFALGASLIAILSFGIYFSATKMFKFGQDSKSKLINSQTLAILDLTANNEDLESQVLTLNGENSQLKLLIQTQKNDLDNLRSTVESLNATITTLQDEKTATDEVVKNLNSNVEYLNSYIEELENKLEAYEKVIIPLPDNFQGVLSLGRYKLNKDEILVYASSGTIEDYGLYKYTISSKQFEKVYDSKYLIEYCYEYCDRLIFATDNNYFIYYYNNEFNHKDYRIEDAPTYSSHIVPVDDTHEILVVSDYGVYKVDKENFEFTKSSITRNYPDYVYNYNDKYACLYDYYYFYVIDISNFTVIQSLTASYISPKLSDYGVATSTGVLYIFDMNSGEFDIEEVSNLSTSNVYKFKNYLIFNDKTTYQFYVYNTTTKELNSISGCPTTSFRVHQNGDEDLYITYNNDTNIYAINFESNSLEVFNSSYGGNVYILFLNNGKMLISTSKNMVYLDKITQSATEYTQFENAFGSKSNINCVYSAVYSFGDDYYLLYRLGAGLCYPLLFNFENNILKAKVSGGGSSDSFKLLNDFDDMTCFDFGRFYVYDKKAHDMFVSNMSANSVEYIEDQNGYHIYKYIKDDTITYVRYDSELQKFVSYAYEF